MYYKLQVSETSAFSELAVNKIVEEITEDVITCGLEPGTLYYWRAKSINNQTGKESDWSSLCWFITRPEDIIIIQGSHADGYEGINVIYFEGGINRASTCFAPEGTIADNLCRSSSACCDAVITEKPIGSDTLGNRLCGQRCSELL